MPTVTDRRKAFELNEINHENQEVVVVLSRDLAEAVARILVEAERGRGGRGGANPAVWALAQQMYNATDVIRGLKDVGDYPELAEVEIVGEAPTTPIVNEQMIQNRRRVI